MPRTYTKEDVDRSYHQGHSGAPMANVKVRATMEDGWRDFARYEPDADPRFTPEWVEENVSEETLDAIWWRQCEWGYEQLQDDAREIWHGSGVNVYAAGRMGGWAVVEGIGDVDEWDAVALAKWRRFERYAKGAASDIPYQSLASVYLNEFAVWAADRLEDEPEQDVPELLHATSRARA